MVRLAGTSVDIREVGPRDGLQPERPLAVADRVRLIKALLAAGVRHVEAVAFVLPDAVPAMAGAADVLAALGRPDGVMLAALVPNRRGAEAALEAGVDELTVTISASEAYNQRNVRRSIAESEAEVAGICSLAAEAGVLVDVVVSCAFGSPYEGDIEPADVGRLADRLLDAGCDRLTYADTTGMATPIRIHALLDETGSNVGLHLHQTRGTGLLNAWVGLERGVRRFDTSVGGLGGSPFAAGAAGNVATEELVAVLDDCGVVTGIDVEGLIDAAALLTSLVEHPVPSAVAAAGSRSRLASADGA
jgi:hydroxymethylglutaryl-CoA lyase